MQVVQLHNHSEYSILDGRSRISELIGRAKELGQPAIALTDHGGMYGTMEFYRQATAAGIKPLLGVEAYVAAGPMRRRDSELDRAGSSTHLTLLAMNAVGFRNLLRLTSKAHLEGFYYRPRIDFDCLVEHGEGLIVLSGCLGSEVASLALEEKYPRAEQVIQKYADAFGERYFLEIHDHGLEKQKKVNKWIIGASRKFGIHLVAACDSHYVRKEDAKAHDVLLAIQTGSTLDDPARFKVEPYGEYYLKSADEMYKTFGGVDHAVYNTLAVADMCDVVIDTSKVNLPDFDLPEGHDADSYLEVEVKKGLQTRYGDKLRKHHWTRAKHELDVIKQTGYAKYFLIVQDYVRYARENGVMAVPRGSVAGSLCMHALGVCDIDPVQYGILFERFLHAERKGMPDVDMDFADDRRDDVIRYMTTRYGKESVAHIGTFSTLGARAAVKDVSRVMGVDFDRVNAITRAFPAKLDLTIAEARQSDEVRRLIANDSVMNEVLEIAQQIEGLVRSFGTHAAGMLVTSGRMDDVVPVQLPPKNAGTTAVTQWDNNNHTALIESIGLSKFDFLGLANLTIIREACALIKDRHGVDLYGQSGEKLYSHLPTDYKNDMAKRTYDMLAQGETTAVFQLESAGMRRVLRLVKPTRITDLPAVVALFRPGPMENVPTFAAAKHGEISIPKYHPEVDKLLDETYGVVTYQDQVLELARNLAGFTWGEVDILRKGMGKKMPEVIEKQRQKFIDGCVQNGYNQELAQTLWETMSPFAGYGFNKAHAYCYGYVAYITAFLKANFPAEYMCAVLTQEAGNPEKIGEAISECKRLGVSVLPPHIEESNRQFTVVGDTIRFGLGAIANMGEAAIAAILRARQQSGPFRTLDELIGMVDTGPVNSRVLQNLAKCGALDHLGPRASVLATIPGLLDKKKRTPGSLLWKQIGMFSGAEEMVRVPELSLERTLQYEKEVLGMFVSGHPLDSYRKMLEESCTDSSTSLLGRNVVVVGGMVTRTKIHQQKNGKTMMFFEIEDFNGTISCVAFASTYSEYMNALMVGKVIQVEGVVRLREDSPTVVANVISVYHSPKTSIDTMGEILRWNITEMPVAMRLATLWHMVLASETNSGPITIELVEVNGREERSVWFNTDEIGATMIRKLVARERK